MRNEANAIYSQFHGKSVRFSLLQENFSSEENLRANYIFPRSVIQNTWMSSTAWMSTTIDLRSIINTGTCGAFEFFFQTNLNVPRKVKSEIDKTFTDSRGL